jgi:geranylgeranyl diphosphate synthase type II
VSDIALIGAAVLCPLLLAGLADNALVPWRRFAAEIGVLFQIVDDILDVTGTDEGLGKRRGRDARHGKQTYVTEYGLEGARRMAADCHSAARDTLSRSASAAAAELEQITDFIFTRTS